MPIETRCGQCDKLLKAPDTAAGKTAKCPQCGNPVKIPQSGGGAGGGGRSSGGGRPKRKRRDDYEDDYEDDYGGFDDYEDDYEDDYGAPPPPRRRSGGGGGRSRGGGSGGRKPCPMCGEMIAREAVKCRFCGERVSSRSAPRRRSSRSSSSGEMTGVDWVLCVLCPGIACIVGIVACCTGDGERGGKMIGFGFLFAVLWNAINLGLRGVLNN